MKSTLAKTLAVVAVAALPALASAQLTANVSLTTNYKFRGQDQDVIGKNGSIKDKAVKPALQGGFDYAHESGFYIGNWNSSVNWLAGNSLESDIYGGYKFKAGEVDLDAGLLTSIYPGNSLGNTTEAYAGATFGPLSAKYSHTLSEDYFGWAGTSLGSGLKGRNTGYLNLAFAQEVAPKLTFKASVGFTRFASDIKDNGVPNYMDYSVGGAYDLGEGFSLGANVVGANKRGFFGPVNKNRLIVSITKTL